MSRFNQTREDAFRRVADAQVGCLINATPEFLTALLEFIASWTCDIIKGQSLLLLKHEADETRYVYCRGCDKFVAERDWDAHVHVR